MPWILGQLVGIVTTASAVFPFPPPQTVRLDGIPSAHLGTAKSSGESQGLPLISPSFHHLVPLHHHARRLRSLNASARCHPWRAGDLAHYCRSTYFPLILHLRSWSEVMRISRREMTSLAMTRTAANYLCCMKAKAKERAGMYRSSSFWC